MVVPFGSLLGKKRNWFFLPPLFLLYLYSLTRNRVFLGPAAVLLCFASVLYGFASEVEREELTLSDEPAVSFQIYAAFKGLTIVYLAVIFEMVRSPAIPNAILVQGLQDFVLFTVLTIVPAYVTSYLAKRWRTAGEEHDGQLSSNDGKPE